MAVSQANFGSEGPTIFEANVAATVGGRIEIRLDSTIGPVIGILDVPVTGGSQDWRLIRCEVERVTGIHNIFFMFKATGDVKENLFNFDYWQFK